MLPASVLNVSHHDFIMLIMSKCNSVLILVSYSMVCYAGATDSDTHPLPLPSGRTAERTACCPALRP